ncbi:YCF48-related protein [Acidicapsa dinghuensis]|uniref:YCF48-related protein n=1 Tax=Acidicapsa dinghuensis TaxID=2218256 RepID=A0ABW1E9R5_9BACT|nr:YCF48-related protein [Acidicapsa dinghuensis]
MASQSGKRRWSFGAALMPADRAGQRRLFVFAGSLVMLALAAWLAWRQSVPPQFEERPTPLSWRWWSMLLEERSVLRPAVTSNNLAAVTFVTPRLGWAVGKNGTIIHTEDGGASWKWQASDASNVLNSVTFVTPRLGWAVGSIGTILHTEDGGANWQGQASNTSDELNSVTFATPQLGWAVGTNGTILHTKDGGANWERQASNASDDLRSVKFATPQSGWAVGSNGAILHTEDGGANWKRQTSGGSNYLYSVTFITPQSGWAVGSSGTILHTEDGGANWKRQTSNTSAHLTSVTFATPQSGWAAGTNGTILHTEDGGVSWNQQISRTPYLLSSVNFATPQLGWAVGDEGIILHTEDRGASWKKQADISSDSLYSVTFATPQSGWAVSFNGTILHTEDGGTSWKRQATNDSDVLNSVTFATPQSGWAVGWNGTILHTENGGVSWTRQASYTSAGLDSVAFAGTQMGWAVGLNGTILHTEDGGVNWKSQANAPNNFISVTFATPQSGSAVGTGGTILHTEDGGVSWKRQISNTANIFTSVTFATPQSGWVVGDEGMILHTEDGGVSWRRQASPDTENLDCVTFVTPRSGWAVGTNGTILHTDDAGASWSRQTGHTKEGLHSVAFVTSQSGWVVGWGGTILHTEDGGKHWRWMGYRRWPAPWFYLAMAICAAGMVYGCWPVPPAALESIEEIANSDLPITTLKEDTLNYGVLVKRLARFIQNPKTSPPLVLSLQAPWGMGKSSMMRMLESELKEKRAALTVWFNAWHHQKEDQLLACLMEAVQKQAVPAWFTPVGISFRLDLLRVRLFGNRDRLALTVLALGALASSSLWLPIFHVPHSNWANWARGGGAVVLTWLVLQPLRAFKTDPEKLMDRTGEWARRTVKDLLTLPSLVGKTDVREEFAANLKDVVEALEPQRLVIFLDDLDRCRPEQVIQILEAINFLSSVSKCFVFVGADYEKVEALAAQQFEAIAVQEFENREKFKNRRQAGGPNEVDPVQLRVDYARLYMRKIINLRLNLKRSESLDLKDFLSARPQEFHGWERLKQRAMMTVGAIALGAIAFFAFLYPQSGSDAEKTQISTMTAAVPEHPAKAVPGEAGVAAPENGPSAQQPVAKPMTVAADIDRDEVGWEGGKWVIGGTAVLLAAGFLIYWFSRPKQQAEAEDPQSFAEALREKSGSILENCRAPREVRRFLNYLRLVAGQAGESSTESAEGLRKRFKDFDRQLVALATNTGHDAELDVRRFYESQCELFGLDPATFRPIE